ncbi:3-beta hydroxysteroid dehydrogenase/isomerase family-domain-containing protein [Dipodascopsis uninucleata]
MENPSIKSVLIIGGSGFLGNHLVDQFYNLSPRPEIHTFDIRAPAAPSPKFYKFKLEDIQFHKGDLTDPESVRAIIKESHPDVIVHSASPVHGMGKELYYKVNVDGTRTVVDVALEFDFIKALVYTSSASVIYNGLDLRNADETHPIPKVAMDAYNETKVIGEQIVREANLKGSYKTCMLRPSGLFGPGDRQFMPNILNVMKTSGAKIQIGDNLNLFDFTYIGNVAYSHVLAALALLDPKKSDSVAGEAFFITNDSPVYFFAMARTIWAHRGFIASYNISMPRDMGMALAYLSEVYSWLRGKEALFTRFRVAFTCANRYFNINKAKRYLGYHPIIGLEEGIVKALEWVDEEQKMEENKKDQ